MQSEQIPEIKMKDAQEPRKLNVKLKKWKKKQLKFDHAAKQMEL